MSTSSPLAPKSTLRLSIPPSNVSIPFQDALLVDSPPYDALIRALRDASSHARTRLSVAIELADIIETARAALKTIRATLDNPIRVDSWSPNKYDSSKLTSSGSDETDPDCYFSKNATTKARVLFRITSKDTYYRVKRLAHPDRLKLCFMYDSEDSFDQEDYHEEIRGWVGRFAKMLAVTKTQGPTAQHELHTDSRKRKQGANANLLSKRKPTRASLNQAASPALQPPSVPYRSPYRSNSNQLANTANQDTPPYQNQPAQQTMQQDTFRMDKLAHLDANYQGGLVTPLPGQVYYQEQHVDSALQLEGHQLLPPQGQQRQEQGQQQGQQQELQQELQQEQQQEQEQEQEQGMEQQQSMADPGSSDLSEFYEEFLWKYLEVQ